MGEFTHFNNRGEAVMVDVSEKKQTVREAIAAGTITMSRACFLKLAEGGMGKGDVLGVARIAGIMGAKKTSELIPLCHVLNLSKVELEFFLLEQECAVKAVCTVRTVGKTGVEMEALTGVSTALLTITICVRRWIKVWKSEISVWKRKPGEKAGYTRGRWKAGSSK